jgi:hypothetical protein
MVMIRGLGIPHFKLGDLRLLADEVGGMQRPATLRRPLGMHRQSQPTGRRTVQHGAACLCMEPAALWHPLHFQGHSFSAAQERACGAAVLLCRPRPRSGS